MSTFMYNYANSQLPARFTITGILNSLQIFIRIIRDKPKVGNLLYQKHVQSQCYSSAI